MLGDVDKHVPSACLLDPDGQAAELPKLELEL